MWQFPPGLANEIGTMVSCQLCKGVLASPREFSFLVMAGHSRSKNGVLKTAYVPAIPITKHRASIIEITGTSPVMTIFSGQ
jgi:hypothetical protein